MQLWHAVRSNEVFPAGQFVQVEAPERAEIWPAAQSLHVLAPAPAYVPAPQLAQPGQLPEGEYFPAGQAVVPTPSAAASQSPTKQTDGRIVNSRSYGRMPPRLVTSTQASMPSQYSWKSPKSRACSPAAAPRLTDTAADALSTCGEHDVRLAQRMRVGQCIPVGAQL
jgi:hypothetical protein